MPLSGRERIALPGPDPALPMVGGYQPTASDRFLVRVLEAEGLPLNYFLPHHTSAEEAEKAGINALDWRMWPVVRAGDSCFCHLFSG